MAAQRTITRWSSLALVSAAIATSFLLVPSTRSKAQQPSTRADLRAGIIALRVEIGLLQVELENDREALREAMRNPGLARINNEGGKAEIDEACRVATDAELSKMMRSTGEDGKVDKATVARIATRFDAAVKARDKVGRDKIVDEFKKYIFDCMSEPDEELIARQAYTARLAIIADKELHLEDEMKRYREAR